MSAPFGASGPTVNLAVNAGSQRVEFDPDGNGTCVMVLNTGTVPVFVAFGGDTVTAAVATGQPIPPNVPMSLRKFGATYVAAIAEDASPSTVYFTPGEGL